SNKFKKVLEEVLNSDKVLLAVLHRAYLNKFRRYGEVFWLEKGHFEEVKEKIKERLKLK
ncbi:MAG TPA: NTPase, partial [Candidatus Aenigmarchaeota archaeon]|nr:NTPase [Candidatus Aenigmarchaeota archaeon]